MIAKGTLHNNGARLAAYMVTGKEGERAELFEVRGFASDDILAAFRSVDVQADGTRIVKPLFHVQVRNPEGEELTREQWLQVADRIESQIGYVGQPRALSFHIDEETGHEHMHLAWSRIDADAMTAKPLPFFKLRLKEACRDLEEELDITRVRNERERPEIFSPSRDEQEQNRRLDIDQHDVSYAIRDAYDRSDGGKAFAAALSDQGLTLCQGERRDFIVLDQEGGLHVLGKRLLGDSAAQVRHKLADLDRAALPTVEEGRAHLPERAAPEPLPILEPEAAPMPAQAEQHTPQARAAPVAIEPPTGIAPQPDILPTVERGAEKVEAALPPIPAQAEQHTPETGIAPVEIEPPTGIAPQPDILPTVEREPEKVEAALPPMPAQAELHTPETRAAPVAIEPPTGIAPVPDIMSTIARGAGKVAPVIARGLGRVIGAVEGLAAGLERFFFGGGKSEERPPPPVAQAAPVEPPAKVFKRETDMQTPQEALQNADFKAKAQTFPLGVRPEIVEEMRRRIEQARERERDDDERDRER